MLQVLLVDDEPSVRSGMKKLIDWEKYGFVLEDTARSGAEGRALQKAKGYDLIITDLRMPGMDGLTLIRTLLEDGYRGQFMILTAYGEFEYARQAMEYGVRCYLLKPIDERILIQYLADIRGRLENERASQGIPETEDTADAVMKVRQYAGAHYRENLSLHDVAEKLSFNPAYLGRVFKRSEGITFSEYLNRIRVEKAKLLLESGRDRVFEIATAVGYQDESYFNRVFKRIEGITPSEFREKREKGGSRF